MITESFVGETAVMELYKKLPGLSKHNYNTIDKLLRTIAQKHEMNHDALNDLFVKKFNRSPDSWVKGKLDESDVECDLEQEVDFLPIEEDDDKLYNDKDLLNKINNLIYRK